MIGRLVPVWIWWAMIAALGAALGVQTVRHSHTLAQFATYRAEAEQRAREAEAEQRRVETVRQANVDKEVQNAQARIDAERADAAVARVDVRVRDAATRIIYRACPNPKPASAGPPAPDSQFLLADVFAKLDARAAELAQIAGERGAAGALCESYADSLTVKQ